MSILNPYNLKVNLISDTYLLDYRQLTGDEIEVIANVNDIQEFNTSNVYISVF